MHASRPRYTYACAQSPSLVASYWINGSGMSSHYSKANQNLRCSGSPHPKTCSISCPPASLPRKGQPSHSCSHRSCSSTYIRETTFDYRVVLCQDRSESPSTGPCDKAVRAGREERRRCDNEVSHHSSYISFKTEKRKVVTQDGRHGIPGRDFRPSLQGSVVDDGNKFLGCVRIIKLSKSRCARLMHMVEI